MDYKYLSNIRTPEDIKGFNTEQLNILCEEIRDCMINTVSKNGGHLASSLGAVELTVALHRVFDSPKDSILFDVGHQSYAHKLVTGRFDRFSTVRQEGGLSGFMRPGESIHDPFVTGHSSNSISASYGIYKAKSILGEDGYTISVIGDGALTGGMVYEALNNSGFGHKKFIVILNDNKMSISRNVGSLARHLTVIRSKKNYRRFKKVLKKTAEAVPFIGHKLSDKLFKSKTMIKNAIYRSNLFESMGFNYLGPVDGHDIDALVNIFNIAKNESRPVFIHIITKKGKGFSFAESDPKSYHGVSSFNIEEGMLISGKTTFSDIFGNTLCEMAEKDEKVCAITAAMTSGTGLTDFSEKFPTRFFDVGIAEEHAATFAGGLAIKGVKPYFAVYSSFLQRSYDQLIHDIATENLPVRLCVDRAGIVGEDGESHQGLFDTAYLSTVPNMVVYSPTYYCELKNLLYKSLDFDFPSAIRYPRGIESENKNFTPTDNDYDFYGNSEILVVGYGRTAAEAFKAQEQNNGITVLKLNKIHPIPLIPTEELKKYKNILFFEEGIKSGGIAEQFAAYLLENGINAKYKIFAVDNEFVKQAKTESALNKYNLDCESILKIVKEVTK